MLSPQQYDQLIEARDTALDLSEQIDEDQIETEVITDALTIVLEGFLFLFNAVESSGLLAQLTARKLI